MARVPPPIRWSFACAAVAATLCGCGTMSGGGAATATSGASGATTSEAAKAGADPGRVPASVTDSHPPHVVRAFFAAPEFPQKLSYLTGEMAAEFRHDPTIGEGLPADARLSFRRLQLGATSAVWAVSITVAEDHVDYYAYLERDGGRWLLAAIRALAVSPELAAVGGPETALAVSPDTTIERFGLTHLAELERVAAWFVEHPTERELEPDSGEDAAAPLARFDFASASTEPGYGRDVFIAIDGLLDNAAGFVYVPLGERVPAMTPYEYIFVERIAPGWYVYKTT